MKEIAVELLLVLLAFSIAEVLWIIFKKRKLS